MHALQDMIGRALRYASTTRAVESAPGAIDALVPLLQLHARSDAYFLIADEHTWDTAGRAVDSQLRAAGVKVAGRHLFPGEPMLAAEYAHAQAIAHLLATHGRPVPIAIGSGTINDLVKLGSHLSSRPYVCIATACSVDGYASDGAALLTNGAKMTHPCPAPTIVIGDPDIMDSAPAIMRASGYADLMAKIPAGADWLLADFLGEHPIDPVGWSLVQDNLRAFLSDPHDSSAIFTGLTLCGIAMQYMKDSRPVSGAEHLLSHVWEMEHHTYAGVAPLHGIKVGIGTMLITSVYESLISQGVLGGSALQPLASTLVLKHGLVDTNFSPFADVHPLHVIIDAKYPDQERRINRRNMLIQHWHELAASLKQQLYTSDEMGLLLQKAGCPIHPQDIGLDVGRQYATLRKAQLIRNRYTILDALDDLGLMDKVVADMGSR